MVLFLFGIIFLPAKLAEMIAKDELLLLGENPTYIELSQVNCDNARDKGVLARLLSLPFWFLEEPCPPKHST